MFHYSAGCDQIASELATLSPPSPPPHILIAPGYGALKCHRLTSAKVVFINVIQPLWIAVTTTEGPGDMWYAAEKAILCVCPPRCGLHSSWRKRDTKERNRPEAMLRECSQHRTGSTLQDEEERLMPVIIALNLTQKRARRDKTTIFNKKKKKDFMM